MSQRHHFLNTSILSSDGLVLGDVVKNLGGTVIEIAECINFVPLPWLACFRQSDLQPCTAIMFSGAGDEIRCEFMVPCVDVPTAIKNLYGSLPLFEKLTGETHFAREYWQRAIDDLAKVPLPFLTMNVSEMLMNIEPDELTAHMTSALGSTNEALDIIKEIFVSYSDGLLPYSWDAFYGAPEGITDRGRINNSIALDAAIQVRGFAR